MPQHPQATGVLITGAGAVVLSFEGALVQLLSVDQWTILLSRGPLMAAGLLLLSRVGWARTGVPADSLLGEQVGARTWAVAVAVLAGVAIIFSGNLGGGQLVGDLAAVGAAMSIAGTLVIIRRSPTVATLPALAAGALAATLVAAPLAAPGTIGATDALLLVLLGLVIARWSSGASRSGPATCPRTRSAC